MSRTRQRGGQRANAAQQGGGVAGYMDDLVTALLPGGNQRHKTTQSRTSGPLVGVLILDYGLNPFQIAATH